MMMMKFCIAKPFFEFASLLFNSHESSDLFDVILKNYNANFIAFFIYIHFVKNRNNFPESSEVILIFIQRRCSLMISSCFFNFDLKALEN